MKSNYLFFALLAFIIFGCGDNNTNQDNSSKEIYPLAVGNSWSYQVMSYNSTNKDSVKIFDTLTTYVYKKITINGEDWYSISPDGKSSKVLLINRKDGLWGCIIEDSSKINIDSAFLGFKYPTFVNDSNIKNGKGYLTVNLNNEVSTILGKFNCIRYIDIHDQILESNGTYISPGVGVVKDEFITSIHQTDSTSVPDTAWIRQVLYKYHLNSK